MKIEKLIGNLKQLENWTCVYNPKSDSLFMANKIGEIENTINLISIIISLDRHDRIIGIEFIDAEKFHKINIKEVLLKNG